MIPWVIIAFSILASVPATAQDRPIPRMQERFNVGGYIEVGRARVALGRLMDILSAHRPVASSPGNSY